jgi:Domain of unknown function (DUF4055)
MTTQQADNPAYRAPAYERQASDLRLVRDCYEGASAIKQGGVTYLPKHPEESPTAYDTRLKRSSFLNYFARTIGGLVGMVFRKSPQLAADVPDTIRSLAEDIDLLGNHLDPFTAELFQSALIDGHAAILVDMPEAVTQAPDGSPATLADERATGMRPYWVLIQKGQILNSRYERAGGRIKLTQVTICETVTEPTGVYTDKMVEQYRVLRPGSWELWRKVEKGETYRLTNSGTTPLTEIPLAIINLNARSPLESKPPLLDLAHENLRHYRLQSDLDWILHFANVPMYVEIAGTNPRATEGLVPVDAGNPDRKIARVLAPNSIYQVENGGDLKVIEHKGTAIGKAQEEIKTTTENMASLGLSVLINKGLVRATATDSVISYEAETSDLGRMVRRVEDGIEHALGFTAQYLGEQTGGSVRMNRDFIRLASETVIQYLMAAESNGQISIDTLWSVLERGDLLPADFDPAAERAKLKPGGGGNNNPVN